MKPPFFTKDSEHFYEEIWTFPGRYLTWRRDSEPYIYLDLNVFQWLLSYTKLLLIAIDRGPLMGAFSQNRSTGSEWIWWLHSESPGIKYLYCAVYLSIGGFYAALRMVFLQIIVNILAFTDCYYAGFAFRDRIPIRYRLFPRPCCMTLRKILNMLESASYFLSLNNRMDNWLFDSIRSETSHPLQR